MSGTDIKVLMVSAEAAPLAKAGGLADVVPSLSSSLEAMGCQVRLIIPKYGFIDERKYNLEKIYSHVEVVTEGIKEEVHVWQTVLQPAGLKVYLIEKEKYFGKNKIYWGNNPKRFLFFSRAVLKVMPFLEYQPDIIHCHDFHTALVPALTKIGKNYKRSGIATAYTIHNLNYQGRAGKEVLATGNIDENSLESLGRDSQDGDVNYMVQGIIHADVVNTVSPSYAEEISREKFGAGLERIIRKYKKKIRGRVNGIDETYFNPREDKDLFRNYSINSLGDKAENKEKIQQKTGLPIEPDKVLIGFISRLVWQKGLDLIDDELMELDAQFLFLGTGDKKYEKKIKKLAEKYPHKVNAQIMFDEKMAKQIYAGADMYLLPSRFEPCGLGQMIAMRYGTVPVVRNTGGLKDTVDTNTGFTFNEFDNSALLKTIKQAMNVYNEHPKKWRKLQKNGMEKDFSWDKSAKKYLKMYKNVEK